MDVNPSGMGIADGDLGAIWRKSYRSKVISHLNLLYSRWQLEIRIIHPDEAIKSDGDKSSLSVEI